MNTKKIKKGDIIILSGKTDFGNSFVNIRMPHPFKIKKSARLLVNALHLFFLNTILLVLSVLRPQRTP